MTRSNLLAQENRWTWAVASEVDEAAAVFIVADSKEILKFKFFI
jgi:hypothetical protein